MFIGRLNHPESGLSYTCRFYRRGTPCPLEADIEAQPAGAFGWTWPKLMDVGVDVAYTWPSKLYIGAVCLKLAAGAAVQTAEIWCGTGHELRCCGRHDARTGESCGGAIDITVGVMASRVVVRLQPLLTDVVLEQLDVIGAVWTSEPLVYPTPHLSRLSGGTLARDRLALIVKGDGESDTAFAASHLQQHMTGLFSQALPVGTSTDRLPAGQVAVTLRLDKSGDPEAYAVDVSAQSVQLTGASRIALLYACETFVQLAGQQQIPLGQIRDKPYKAVRGFHVGLPPRESFAFYRRLLRHVLLPLRYNTLFIEFAGGMRFDRHPEISQAWLLANQAARRGEWPAFPHGDMVAGGGLLEKDEVRELVAYAKSLGFTVIPEVQSLSHVQYITCAHPEIAEAEEEQAHAQAADTRAADQPPSAFYAHSYCPSHETSYAIICDIIDEIVEVVQPERYVHMGHDEVYQLALCPRCQGQDPAELYARHVLRVYAYLKQKGLGMMIWSDMLQPTERYRTHPAIARLPRDIVLLDFIWYFHTDLDMEDHLLPHGFEVVMGNLYSSHYPRYASRAAKPGMTGGEVSTWCRLDEYTLAKKGKLFDLMFSAEMLWSDRYLETARPVYTEIIQRRIPALREALRGLPALKQAGRRFQPLTPAPPARAGLPGALRLWLADQAAPEKAALAAAFDLSGAQRLTDQPLDIPVDACFDRLVFLHATADPALRLAWAPLTQVGIYTVRYADGRSVDVPVEYAGNIWHWAKRYGDPLRHPYYRHQGYLATYMADPVVQAKTETGEDILLLGFEWVNPHPDCRMSGISCRNTGTAGTDILLMAVSGVSAAAP